VITLIVLAIAVFGLLGFRTYRLVHYYKEASTSKDARSRRVAYINFGIHLIVCLAILFLISIVAYGYLLMSNGEL
jgi:hypothetical protein